MPDTNLPESVQSYLEDSAVGTAVDTLLGFKPNRLPTDLTLAELPEYVAARAQAELTRWEFAQACLALWSSIWEPLLEGWQPGALAEILDGDENAITPQAIWECDGFNIWHRRGPFYLWTAVQLTAEATTIAFGLQDEDRPILKDAPGFEWRDDDDWSEWLTHEQSRMPSGFGSEVEKLKGLAAAAIERVNAEIASA